MHLQHQAQAALGDLRTFAAAAGPYPPPLTLGHDAAATAGAEVAALAALAALAMPAGAAAIPKPITTVMATVNACSSMSPRGSFAGWDHHARSWMRKR
ncbi:hypothetical protein ACFFX1_17835 [Dactylosporangium sucinum]|uniref:Uncharacterized protein n=1 Tax=Dactylosporangium sucinum TaxID=1424081 RepID=A0A917TVS0_9ACTN|nr:hypothetical protein [Dactylosporangium sucinum]GGM40428.1 hypothetical protein GCM10007977_047300 [Dactylosporangium sucinum]